MLKKHPAFIFFLLFFLGGISMSVYASGNGWSTGNGGGSGNTGGGTSKK